MQTSANDLVSGGEAARLRAGLLAPVPAFEDRLNRDPRWALTEGSIYFEGRGAVQTTLRKITTRLRELAIPYAVVGGMALFNHGLRRFTEDMDLLVTNESLKEIHQKLEGLGYLPPFSHSKNLRDTKTGVQIKFLVTGGFPGDGKPKPVAFPEPAKVAVEQDGIHYVNLATLVELKLASGMTSTERLKDLADVQELIKILALGQNFAQNLHPFVRDKYNELWSGAMSAQKRYVRLWRTRYPTADEAALWKAMIADGVMVDPEHDAVDDYSYLVTSDPTVARRYDMHDESEIMK